MEEEVCIGQVVHYYNHIHVAVLELDQPLTVGQSVRIKGADHNFVQDIKRMEWEHESIEVALPGQEVGVKVEHDVHEHDKVYLA